MKKFIFSIATLALVACSQEKREIHIACIGDSITEGYAIEKQSDNSFPAQLSDILGEGYEVMNFGRSSTTMMSESDFPYWNVKEFYNAMEYDADVVVIKLGTNDSKSYQWNADKFELSYQSMIDTIRTKQPQPEIKLCLPARAFSAGWQISDSTIVNSVIPIIRNIAQRNNLEVIDLYTPTQDKQNFYVEDGIHPNKEGAHLIADVIAKSIKK